MSLTIDDIRGLLREEFEPKLDAIRDELSELKSEFSSMKSLTDLQVESARASARANTPNGFDFYEKPPGHAFVEPRDAWVPRSDYDTD